MDLILTRKLIRHDGVFSDLRDEKGALVAVTLEHAYSDSKGEFHAKIPTGVYTCKRYFSPHFRYDVFEVLNVPGCKNIEIHRGNYNEDSHGCILIGDQMVMDGEVEVITHSKISFENFMKLQSDCETFKLTVVEE